MDITGMRYHQNRVWHKYLVFKATPLFVLFPTKARVDVSYKEGPPALFVLNCLAIEYLKKYHKYI